MEPLLWAGAGGHFNSLTTSCHACQENSGEFHSAELNLTLKYTERFQGHVMGVPEAPLPAFSLSLVPVLKTQASLFHRKGHWALAWGMLQNSLA